MLSDFEILYSTIVASDGSEAEKYNATPRSTMRRVQLLKNSYMELKNDMLEEVQVMSTRIVGPAKETRAAIQPYKKVIKKREDRKLDYERYKGRTESYEKKTKRSEREDRALAKYQVDLSAATAEYQAADEHLKSTLPGLTTATYSILPHLLNSQIMIQNTLLAHLYTSLHNFAQEHSFQSPPPEMEEIIATFESDFTPLRLELESKIKTIANGKAVREPMTLGKESRSLTGLNIRNGFTQRRTSSQSSAPSKRPSVSVEPPSSQPPSVDLYSKPKLQSSSSRSLSQLSTGMLTPDPNTAGSTPSPSASPALEQKDYFSPASHSNTYRPRNPSSTSIASAASASSIGKKKPPPPPPPPKRNPSYQDQYVTALYDFDGQGPGDLAFREGDRIKVVKKTESEQDWWEGELRGAKGSFPANYCRM